MPPQRWSCMRCLLVLPRSPAPPPALVGVRFYVVNIQYFVSCGGMLYTCLSLYDSPIVTLTRQDWRVFPTRCCPDAIGCGWGGSKR